MSTTFDVIDRLYPFLNCATVTTTLDGSIYRRKKPLNSESRDIVINTLSLRDSDRLDVQPGHVFINCFAKNIEDRPDETNLKAMADAVISRLNVWNQGSTYFHLEKTSENVYPDEHQKNMSYDSIRLRVITE